MLFSVSHRTGVNSGGGINIPSFINIADAARALKLNPHRTKGIAEGMGIEFLNGGRAYLMTREDFARLKARVQQLRKVKRRAEVETASV